MTLTRLALALAVTGIAVNMVMKSRRSAASYATGSPSDDEMDAELAANRAAMPATATGAGDSPNAAERLQADGLANTTGSDDLLRPNAEGGAIEPGMPDLTRGA